MGRGDPQIRLSARRGDDSVTERMKRIWRMVDGVVFCPRVIK